MAGAFADFLDRRTGFLEYHDMETAGPRQAPRPTMKVDFPSTCVSHTSREVSPWPFPVRVPLVLFHDFKSD